MGYLSLPGCSEIVCATTLVEGRTVYHSVPTEQYRKRTIGSHERTVVYLSLARCRESVYTTTLVEGRTVSHCVPTEAYRKRTIGSHERTVV